MHFSAFLFARQPSGSEFHYNRRMDSLVIAGRQFHSRLIVGTG